MYLWKAAVHLQKKIFLQHVNNDEHSMLPSSWKIVEDNTLSRGSPLDTELMFRSLSLLYHRYVPTNHSKKDDEENLGLVRLNATWGPCNGGLFNCVVVLKLLWPAESFLFFFSCSSVWSMTTIKPSSLNEESRPHSMCGDLFTTVYWDLLLSLSLKRSKDEQHVPLQSDIVVWV